MPGARLDPPAGVREWLDYAEADYTLTQELLDTGNRIRPWLIAFHAQQAAEKYLKAYLASRRIDFPFTHHIGRLLEICATVAIWPARLEPATELTDYAATSRYPGEAVKVTRRDARRAIGLTRSVRDAVIAALKSEGNWPKGRRV